jgi:hypothetical protein
MPQSNPLGSTFLGGAVDEFTVWYTSEDSKTDSGYYISNHTTMAVQAEVVNYKPTPQQIYLTMDIEYLPGKVGRDAMSTLLTVTGCGALPGWYSDKPQMNMTSGEYPLLQDGTIINTRGHLHDGGVAMELYLNKKLICNSEATYGGSGEALQQDGKKWESIVKMHDCKESFPVKKGDILTMKAVYDKEKHPLRVQHGGSHGGEAEEMGIVTFSFVPDSDPMLT